MAQPEGNIYFAKTLYVLEMKKIATYQEAITNYGPNPSYDKKINNGQLLIADLLDVVHEKKPAGDGFPAYEQALTALRQQMDDPDLGEQHLNNYAKLRAGQLVSVMQNNPSQETKDRIDQEFNAYFKE